MLAIDNSADSLQANGPLADIFVSVLVVAGGALGVVQMYSYQPFKADRRTGALDECVEGLLSIMSLSSRRFPP